jgi:hypothetical protein
VEQVRVDKVQGFHHQNSMSWEGKKSLTMALRFDSENFESDRLRKWDSESLWLQEYFDMSSYQRLKSRVDCGFRNRYVQLVDHVSPTGSDLGNSAKELPTKNPY